jgi:hypothetical protein
MLRTRKSGFGQDDKQKPETIMSKDVLTYTRLELMTFGTGIRCSANGATVASLVLH